MLAAPRLTSPTFPNPVLKLPTLANPRLPASIERRVVPAADTPDSCWPRLPMPDTAAGVPKGNTLVL
ncbi:Uncharacterised protein [Mycobacterium tuberculosis]|nr:Uncharacterised protein [Mycobacterium tuberculosis]